MPAVTKWRVRSPVAYGTGALSISSLQLYAGATRVDATATITCSHAPSVGSLANLQDANLSTLCTFARKDFSSPGFWLEWELASAAEVTGIRIGGGTAKDLFPAQLDLQYWSGTNWEPIGTIGSFAWPGASTLGTEISFTVFSAITSALVHFEGTSGALASGTIESSPNSFTLSGSGGAFSSAAAKFGTTSLRCNGSTYCYVGPTGHPAFDMQTGNFGIDCWVRLDTHAGGGNSPCLFGSNDGPRIGGYGLYVTGGKPEFFVENNSLGNFSLLATTTLALNTWYHVAISREGNVFRIFVNGVLENTATHATPCVVSPTRPSVVGSYFYGGGGPFGVVTGYIDELRVVKGLAPWTASFTPPTAPYEALVGASPFLRNTLNVALGLINGQILPGVASPLALMRPTAGMAFDLYHGGRGRLYGTTEVDGSPDFPKRCKVRLQKEKDGYTIAEKWSNADGTWSFDYLNMNEVYCVQAFDHLRDKRATIADNLTPELMA